jgi:hypothetical protein
MAEFLPRGTSRKWKAGRLLATVFLSESRNRRNFVAQGQIDAESMRQTQDRPGIVAYSPALAWQARIDQCRFGQMK